MKKDDSISIGIIGAGNMGAALALGLAKSYKPENIGIFDIDEEKAGKTAKSLKIRREETLKNLVDNRSIIILAVKPDGIVPVLEEIKRYIRPECVIVSIAAGISLGVMQKTAGQQVKIVRAMPNTPALLGEGMTALCAGESVTGDEMATVHGIFQCAGRVLEVPEKLMDAVTALSGSGPAFAFTFIQALADGGVKMGIPRDKAAVMAAQTVLGAAKMVLESIDDPITLRSRVASPGGTTIEGIHVLERAGFTGIVMDAVEKAAIKSKKLGEG
jgi:pyrroline-5-carboxylate reductase